MTPRIQYVTTPDGVRIAYATFGEGDGVPLVVLRPSRLSHVEAEWRFPLGSPFRAFERLAHGRRVVRLDVRGCGLSDRDVADRSLEVRVGDVATVLIVDDQKDVREPHALALEGAGYRVIQAESWASAVALLKATHAEVDLIVTDLVMPGDAGVDVFLQLRSEYGPIPVVVFSGYPNVMRLLHGVLDGVVEWLQKPLDVATVVQAVDRALHRVRA
jgi:CheY-like chemotaxis protein